MCPRVASLTTNEMRRNLRQGYDAKMAKKATGVFMNFVEPPNRGRRFRGRRVVPTLLIGLLIIFAVLALV